MFQTIDTFVDLKVDPSIVCILGKVVFIDEFLGNVPQSAADVLRSVKWCSKVEVEMLKQASRACGVERTLLK